MKIKPEKTGEMKDQSTLNEHGATLMSKIE